MLLVMLMLILVSMGLVFVIMTTVEHFVHEAAETSLAVFRF
jgi:hypothetical protein